MGFFDSIKKTLGLIPGEFELRVQPDGCHVGGVIRGEVVLRAKSDLQIVTLTLDLVHEFPDEYGTMHEVLHDGGVIAERVAMRQGEQHAWPFFVEIGPEVVPSAGRFSWKLRTRANLQSGSSFDKEQAIQLRFSPLVGTIVALIQEQFGFAFERIGADDESVWMSFTPGASIKSYFRGLEIAYDEGDDVLLLWVALRDFRPAALHHFEEEYDEREGAVELEIDRGRYMAGEQVDRDGLMALLKPLFAL